MSMNIYLQGTRLLTTQKGRKVLDVKNVERILQTPTNVTYEILANETFENRLYAYCEWEENLCDKDEGYWTSVITEESLEFYKNYNNSEYSVIIEDEENPYKEIRDYYVEQIKYPGDDQFEELASDDFIEVIAVVRLKQRPAREVLNLIIKDMIEDEYIMEWGMI